MADMPFATEADIRRFAPRAQTFYVQALLDGKAQFKAAGIVTPLRWCHFMAQCFHETGEFTIVRENTRWSAKQMCNLWPTRFKAADPVFQTRYALCRGDEREYKLAEMAYGASARPDLGNCEEGDGWNYRGGGFLQGTGRNWYREVGQAIGHDLENSPDLIENPAISLQATLWYWTRYKINALADANNLRGVGNQINRGNPYSKYEPIHAKERKAAFDRAWAIWGTGQIATSTDIDVGSHGSEVTALQLRLRELRYAVGSADGVFGPETGRAVAGFKADWARERGTPLETGTSVGVLTRAALAEADPVERAERAQATKQDLLEAGSSEMKAGQEMKAVGRAVTGAGFVGVAHQAGALDTVTAPLQQFSATQSVMAPAAEALRWCGAHLPFIALLLVGLLVYYRGEVIQRARLLAHRLGFNLGR